MCGGKEENLGGLKRRDVALLTNPMRSGQESKLFRCDGDKDSKKSKRCLQPAGINTVHGPPPQKDP